MGEYVPDEDRDEVFKNCRSKTDERFIRMNRKSKKSWRAKSTYVTKSSFLFRFGLKFAVQNIQNKRRPTPPTPSYNDFAQIKTHNKESVPMDDDCIGCRCRGGVFP